MRAARRILFPLFLILSSAACDDGELPEDAVTCQVSAQCADFTDEGGMCCGGVCVDCWADSDGDGNFDCSDPDYFDGICTGDR